MRGGTDRGAKPVSLQIETLPDAAAVAGRAVAVLDGYGAECLAERGQFVVSLAGGSTPKAIYKLWGEASTLDWARLSLVYGDERCVPPDHADSNAGMVAASLLEQLTGRGLQLPTVYRMAGEDVAPARAAAAYENALKELNASKGGIDLALLGIGGDGHTASLFPGAAALDEKERLCVATTAPDGKTRRITLTAPALKAARRIMFMAAGPDKAEIIQTVVQGPVTPRQYPSQMLLRDDALEVTLLLDEAAAAKLA